MPHSGRPSTSVNPVNETKMDTLIRADRRITLNELTSELGVSHGSAHNLVGFPGFSKMYSAGSRDN